MDGNCKINIHSIFSSLRPPRALRWAGVAMLALLLLTSLAQAGVVKSKGVHRIVDGPHGEVEVTSVLDDGSGHVEERQHHTASASSERITPDNDKPKAEKIDYSAIEYHDEPIAEEEQVQPEQKSSPLGPIIMGVVILLVGFGVIFFMNKRQD